MSLVFYRRRNLGRGSVKGMREVLAGLGVSSVSFRTWLREANLPPATLIVRWGNTSTLRPQDRQAKVLNQAEAIHRVNDKKGFRMLLQTQAPGIVPTTIITLPTELLQPVVVRTATHSRGRNLWLVNTLEELVNVTSTLPDWYASEYIKKVAEYRVYVVNGRVATVAQKTPDNPDAVAWNVAQGGRFDVVRWGSWPLEVCRVAIEGFRHSGLDFGGVDVMVDETGRAYLIEINSAPSLPALSDGSVSYRQECMAKSFAYIYEKGNEWIEPSGYSNWRDVIHPAIWSE